MIVVLSREMKIHDSERSLAHIIGQVNVFERLCMANGTFCYLVSIIAVV